MGESGLSLRSVTWSPHCGSTLGISLAAERRMGFRPGAVWGTWALLGTPACHIRPGAQARVRLSCITGASLVLNGT